MNKPPGRHRSTIGAQELLGSTSATHLAYVEKDGTPRVIPVGFFRTVRCWTLPIVGRR
jgi:hypothetical protein